MLIYIITLAVNRLADEIDNAAYRRGIFWSCPLQVAVGLGAIRQVQRTKGHCCGWAVLILMWVLEYECLVMLYERALLECKGSSLSMKRTCYPMVRTIAKSVVV